MADTKDQEAQARVSFTMDQSTRKAVRIAAALSDKEVGEWAVDVLTNAANAQIKQARM